MNRMTKRIFTLTAIYTFSAVAAFAKGKFITHCTVTTYNNTAVQCDSDPCTTADGTKINSRKLKNGTQRIAAVSRDLLWCIPFGSIIEVEGLGRFEVRDTMNARYSHHIDILLHHTKKHFKQENVKITVINKPNKT